MLVRFIAPLRIYGVAASLAALAACGGGVSTTPIAAPAGVVTATPSPSASATAAAQSAVVTSAFVPGTPLAFPSVGGLTGTITIPSGSTIATGSTISLQSFVGQPAGGPTVQSLRRSIKDFSPEAVCSLQAQFNFNETLSGIPGVSVSGPGISAAAQYFAELFDTTTNTLVGSAPGTATAGTVTFASGTASIPVVANRQYLIVVVSNSRLGASPLPGATATASASASPGASATPSPAASSTAPSVVSITDIQTTGTLSGLTMSPANVPYVIDQKNNAIGYSSNGGYVTFPVSAPSPVPATGMFGPGGYASPAFGPDGNIWFPHSLANSIGRMNPTTGAYVDFPIPTASSGPEAVAAGPDGAMWFSESTKGKIGRITTAGVITEFAVPAGSNAGIFGIAAGPDGAMWFLENGLGKIGRITTAGAITEFPLSQPGCVGLNLVSGPLNSLWYVGCTGSAVAIDQVTTSGVQTLYPVPAAFHAVNPAFVVTGADGAIWFTDQSVNYVGRLAPAGGGAGTFSQYPYPLVHGSGPGNASANQLGASTDGSIWWTEINTGNIGHLTH